MTDKVTQQAQRLQYLEDYKILCEKYILKLFPEQMLPLTPEDLIKISRNSNQINELKSIVVRKNQELQFASRQIMRLQEEADQWKKCLQKKQEPINTFSCEFIKLQNEKRALEETLRAEVLLNEEQRSCIEILKKTLANKMKELGMTELLQRVVTEIPNKNPMEFLAELTDAKRAEEIRKKQISRYKEVAMEEKARCEEYKSCLLELEKQCQEATKKVKELTRELENTHKELSELKSVNEKIEEEKNVLLDYVEELTATKTKLEADIESLNTLNKKIAEEKLLCNKQIEELKDKLHGYKNKLVEYADRYKELKENYNNNKEKIEAAIELLYKDHELIERRQRELEESFDQIRKEALVKIVKTKEKLENTMERTRQAIESQIVTFREENKELVNDNLVLVKEKKVLEEDRLLLNESLNELRRELNCVKEHSSFVDTKNKELSQQLSEKMKKCVDRVEDNSSTEQIKHEYLKKKNDNVKDELNRLRIELATSKRQAEIKQSQLKQLTLECEHYRQELREVHRIREPIQSKKDTALDQLHIKLLNAQETIKQQDAEVFALRNECIEIESEAQRTKEENKELQKQVREVFKLIKE